MLIYFKYRMIRILNLYKYYKQLEKQIDNGCTQIKILKKISILTLLLTFLSYNNFLLAQEESFNLIKFGIKGYGGLLENNQLNTMANNWIDKVAEESNVEFIGDPITLPFNIEYGYQPFVIIRPYNFLQIGIKMNFAFSKLNSKFQNPLIKQSYELDININSYMPGIYTYLTLTNLEFGGGIFHAYTNVHVNDNFFGYQDAWYGSKTGFELSFGYSNDLKEYIGFTFNIKYRDLLINEFRDKLNRIVSFSNKQKNMSLNMSGFIVEMGLYFQFIKIK